MKKVSISLNLLKRQGKIPLLSEKYRLFLHLVLCRIVLLLVSSLTVALLSNCPGEKIQLDSDGKSSAFSARILQESGKISGNNRSFAASGWVLKSINEKGIFQLELLHNGQTVWKEMLKYSFEPSLLN